MEHEELDLLAAFRLRSDATVKLIDELLDGLSSRPRMFVPGNLADAEILAVYLLDIRSMLLGKDAPDIKKYQKSEYPDIPGSIRSIMYGSTHKIRDQEHEAFCAAMKKMIEALK